MTRFFAKRAIFVIENGRDGVLLHTGGAEMIPENLMQVILPKELVAFAIVPYGL